MFLAFCIMALAHEGAQQRVEQPAHAQKVGGLPPAGAQAELKNTHPPRFARQARVSAKQHAVPAAVVPTVQPLLGPTTRREATALHACGEVQLSCS